MIATAWLIAQLASGGEAMFLPAEVSERVRTLRSESLGERIGQHSAAFLGVPYTEGPLGEAGGLDPDPLYRYDTFDCLTFVEEVMALSLANDPVSVHQVRKGLRYQSGGPSTYENRRHFMLAEWIPQTIEEGWMFDLTPELPGSVELSHSVRFETWKTWSRRSLFPLTDDRLPVGTQRFYYLPLDAAEAAVNRIPAGAVIFTLRKPLDHIPIAITHVGLTVPADKPTMRHATKMGEGGVRDDSLVWYINHLRTYTNWPVAGLVVLMPQDQGPKASRIPTQ